MRIYFRNSIPITNRRRMPSKTNNNRINFVFFGTAGVVGAY